MTNPIHAPNRLIESPLRHHIRHHDVREFSLAILRVEDFVQPFGFRVGADGAPDAVTCREELVGGLRGDWGGSVLGVSSM